MKLEDLNSDRFLNEAFDAEHHERWVKSTRVRRNIYLWLFLTGIVCIMITAFTHQMHMTLLALFLATISLVVMTKYETQLFFLKNLKLRDNDEGGEEKKTGNAPKGQP